MREVIVTGATSMLGAAVVRECVKNGVHVYAVVRPRSEKLNRLPDSRLVTLVESELEGYGSLAGKIRKQCDVLYHFAWGGTDGGGKETAAAEDEPCGIQYA